MLYFNFGIRSGGGIGDVTGMRPYSYSIWFWFKWITDMIFYITVILLVMNMINGIIISTFSQIREEGENRKNDMENVCFICARKREKFEKEKKKFEDHVNLEHSQENYMKFLIALLLTNENDLNSEQTYIYKCFKNNEITFFPVEKTLYLQNEDKEDKEEDEGNQDD